MEAGRSVDGSKVGAIPTLINICILVWRPGSGFTTYSSSRYSKSNCKACGEYSKETILRGASAVHAAIKDQDCSFNGRIYDSYERYTSDQCRN